jgi:hypothetical protein
MVIYRKQKEMEMNLKTLASLKEISWLQKVLQMSEEDIKFWIKKTEPIINEKQNVTVIDLGEMSYFCQALYAYILYLHDSLSKEKNLEKKVLIENELGCVQTTLLSLVHYDFYERKNQEHQKYLKEIMESPEGRLDFKETLTFSNDTHLYLVREISDVPG